MALTSDSTILFEEWLYGASNAAKSLMKSLTQVEIMLLLWASYTL